MRDAAARGAWPRCVEGCEKLRVDCFDADAFARLAGVFLTGDFARAGAFATAFFTAFRCPTKRSSSDSSSLPLLIMMASPSSSTSLSSSSITFLPRPPLAAGTFLVAGVFFAAAAVWRVVPGALPPLPRVAVFFVRPDGAPSSTSSSSASVWMRAPGWSTHGPSTSLSHRSGAGLYFVFRYLTVSKIYRGREGYLPSSSSDQKQT